MTTSACAAAPCFEDTLEAYRYHLPEELIAKTPRERGASRLLVLDRASGQHEHRMFADLPDLLPPQALIVANNSRVLAARLVGTRATGGRQECLLLTPLPLMEAAKSTAAGEGARHAVQAEALLKPSRPVRVGDSFSFDALRVTVLEKGEFGQCRVQLTWTGDLQTLIERAGHLPLPPYMRREADAADLSRYQTVFARTDKTGSVAAPTAGLHMTPAMRERLAARGFGWEEVTLHVGYGTFSPVREADIRNHHMHREYVEVSAATATAIMQARKQGRPVIAMGTTSARTLEGVGALHGGEVRPYAGWINIFIRPGFAFRVVDGLITNFHLPESTLLMLVSALANRSMVLDVYKDAVHNKYAFFSYGDAMLVR